MTSPIDAQTIEAISSGPEPVSVIQDDAAFEFRASLVIAALFFIGFLGWAAWAPLDAGAYAPGQVAVAGNRQAVQHRDGGIVSALMVHEGDMVAAGQPLLTISAGDVRALERGLTGDYLTLLAEKARLNAEIAGRADVTPPPEFAALDADDRPIAAEALRTQIGLLRTQVATASAQKSVLGRQSGEVQAKIGGLAAESSALAEQHRLVQQELEGMQRLAQKGYASDNRIREMQRELASIEGDRGSRNADIASAEQSIGTNHMQAMVVERDLVEKADRQLRDVTEQLNEVQPKLMAARQQLARALVRAPVAGRVVGLRVFTVGGVVTAGETLMEVVPQDHELVIQARMSPDDIDDIQRGMQVKVRFPSLHNHNLPDIYGALATISADVLTDEHTGQHYFTAEVHVPRSELDKLAIVQNGRVPIQAGMPAQVLVTLHRRTMLAYLFEPVLQAFWLTGHEH